MVAMSVVEVELQVQLLAWERKLDSLKSALATLENDLGA
jgi:hypothetical protein